MTIIPHMYSWRQKAYKFWNILLLAKTGCLEPDLRLRITTINLDNTEMLAVNPPYLFSTIPEKEILHDDWKQQVSKIIGFTSS